MHLGNQLYLHNWDYKNTKKIPFFLDDKAKEIAWETQRRKKLTFAYLIWGMFLEIFLNEVIYLRM